MFVLQRIRNRNHWLRFNTADPPEINEYNAWYTAKVENRAEFMTLEEAEGFAGDVIARTTQSRQNGNRPQWMLHVEVVEVA